jgi:glycine oxidase
MDVAVAGGGLIGLSIAFELARRGHTVRVYDIAEPGRAASWAGAGLLAPYSERTPAPLFDACERALHAYPEFARNVAEASGIDPRVHLGGIVHVATSDAELQELERRSQTLRARAVTCAILDRTALLSAEPSLSSSACGALLLGAEGSVDNRRLGRALIAACTELGVRLIESKTIAVRCDTRRALGVVSDAGFAPAEAIVNAAGAWAAQLEGVPVQYLPAVRPVKGQMLAIEVPHGFVRRPVWTSDVYLVPRDDGRLLIGATVEEHGFDSRITAGGLSHLLAGALRAAPSLDDFTVSEQWAGLRPATSDGLPYIGRTALDGLFTATGHFRNGILLAPVTATAIADAIEGTDDPFPAFSPSRAIGSRMESHAAGANS